jgi:hypothetical protein
MDYTQIDRTNCMEIILQQFPAFQAQWDLHLESWIPTLDRPIALDVAEFADFAVDTICLGVEVEIANLAAIVELILQRGDDVISYTFRRMFLQQIAHRFASSQLSAEQFIRKLQPLGYYHWQAMDRNLSISPSGASLD